MARGKPKVMPILTFAVIGCVAWSVYNLNNRVDSLETKSPRGSVRINTIVTRDQSREALLVEMNEHLTQANKDLEYGREVKAKEEIEESLKLMRKVAPKIEKRAPNVIEKSVKAVETPVSKITGMISNLTGKKKSPAEAPVPPVKKSAETKGG